jgi:hypothetical protein
MKAKFENVVKNENGIINMDVVLFDDTGKELERDSVLVHNEAGLRMVYDSTQATLKKVEDTGLYDSIKALENKDITKDKTMDEIKAAK